MRYIGRHRAPRPLYLRRPVIGGVAAVLVVGGPALALAPDGRPTAATPTPPSRTASGTPDTLVPTDGPAPPETSSKVRIRTSSTAPPAITSTGRPPAGTTGPTTRGSTPTTTKPRTTTTKPTKTTATYRSVVVTAVTLANSSVASGGAVSGSVAYTGGRAPFTVTVNQAWLTVSGRTFSGTAPEVTKDTTFTITVTVADGRTRDSGSATLTVLAPAAAAP